MVKRAVVCLIAFLFLAVSALALTMPRTYNYEYVIDDPTDRVVAVLTAKDINGLNNCRLEDGKKVVPTGGDFPHLYFENINKNFGSAVVNVKENTDGMSILFNAESREGFTENNSTTELLQPDDCDSVYPSFNDRTVGIRIGSYDTFELVSVELHTAVPRLVEVKMNANPIVLPCCLAFALACALALFLLDIKFRFSEKIFEFFKNNSKQIVAVAFGLVLSSALAVLVEYAVYRIRLGSDADAFFNPYEAVLIGGVLFIISAIIIFFREMGTKPEKAFFLISFTLCILFTVVCPFGHVSWDDNTHYRWALNASYIGPTSYLTEADRRVIVANADTMINAESDFAQKEEVEEAFNSYYYNGIVYTRDDYTTVAHAPYGYFLALGRLMKLPFAWMFNMAKFGSALVYCLVCYFAMKRLKSGKMILAAVAMIPTALFLASHFSYDYWTNCFTILGMAYFVGNLQEKDEPISIKDTVIMCAAFGLAALPKLVYALMLVIPFFMKPKKIPKKKVYYSVCVLSVIVFAALLMSMTMSQMKSGGDMRGGEGVNAMGQLEYILGNPFEFIRMMIRYLSAFLSPGEVSIDMIHFAYIGPGVGHIPFLVLVVLIAFTDKNEHDLKGGYGWLVRLLGIAVYAGLAVAVASALYITFTPVGLGRVLGCQGRYLIPLFYPLLSVIGFGGFKNKIPPAAYNTVALSAVAVFSIYNLATLFLPLVS